MSIIMKQLSKSNIYNFLNDIVNLDKTIVKEMGVVYGTDLWDGSNFLKDLKRKWEFSHMALSGKNRKICGFIITSEMLPFEIHIHRIAVDPDFRHMGIGGLLVNKTVELAQQYRYKRLTVETNRLNTPAISFYRKHGFVCLTKEELSDYAIKRKKGVQLVLNFIRETDGSEFYILQKVINVNSKE